MFLDYAFIARNGMKIAVTSQNCKTVIAHAGKCRKFRIYATDDKTILNKTLLEPTPEQSAVIDSRVVY